MAALKNFPLEVSFLALFGTGNATWETSRFLGALATILRRVGIRIVRASGGRPSGLIDPLVSTRIGGVCRAALKPTAPTSICERERGKRKWRALLQPALWPRNSTKRMRHKAK